MESRNILLQICLLPVWLCCFCMGSSATKLQPGLNNIQIGRDVSMEWRLSATIFNTTVYVTMENVNYTLVIKQNTTTKELFLQPIDNSNVKLNKMKVVLDNDILKFLLKKVALNDSQTVRIGYTKYKLNVYKTPVLNEVIFRNNMFNISITSYPPSNITWFLNGQPLDNVTTTREKYHSFYTGKYDETYLCYSFIKFKAAVYNTKLVRKIQLPNDFSLYNVDITINGSCYSITWDVTSSKCLHTGVELYTKYDPGVRFIIPTNETWFKQCVQQPISILDVYLRPLFGHVKNGTWEHFTNRTYPICKEELRTTEYPKLFQILAGVGSVVTTILFVCCLSHCILVQKKKEAMKFVPLKVNGVTSSAKGAGETANPLLGDVEKLTENTDDIVLKVDELTLKEENKQNNSTTACEKDSNVNDVNIIANDGVLSKDDAYSNEIASNNSKITFAITSEEDDVEVVGDDVLIELTPPTPTDVETTVNVDDSVADSPTFLSDDSITTISDEKPLIEVGTAMTVDDNIVGIPRVLSEDLMVTADDDEPLIENEQHSKTVDDKIVGIPKVLSEDSMMTADDDKPLIENEQHSKSTITTTDMLNNEDNIAATTNGNTMG